MTHAASAASLTATPAAQPPALDPRLQPIVHAERGRLRRSFVQGVLGGLMGLFLAAVPIGTASAGGAELFAAALGLGCLWFALRSLRAWRAGPLATRTVRLLADGGAGLAAWSVDAAYGQRRLGRTMLRIGLDVALSGATLGGGTWLFLYGKDDSLAWVSLPARARDEVLAALTALAPRRTA